MAFNKRNGFSIVAEQYMKLIQENDGSGWFKPWDMLKGLNPIRSVKGYNYKGSFARAYLNYLAHLKYGGCTIYGNYKQLSEIPVYPVKGSGIDIPKPLFCKDHVDKNGDFVKGKIIGWGIAKVFNLAGCTFDDNPNAGKEIWERKIAKELANSKAVEIGDISERFHAILEANGIGFSQGGNKAYHSPGNKLIVMPFASTFVGTNCTTPTDEYYGAFAHELAHAVQQILGQEESYSVNEVCAECCSMLVCQSLKIGIDLENKVRYSANWANDFMKDTDTLIRGINNGVECAKYILTGMGFDLTELVTEEQEEESTNVDS